MDALEPALVPAMIRASIFATLLCLSWFTAAVSAAGIEDQLNALKGVGPEGAGNKPAQEAWRKLSAADVASLPTILAALDDAGPLAANWLRASVDAIAERQLRSGGKLPTAALEKFAVDTKHSNRARRLAFEWLCRADPTATDRLIPKMIDDPSVEFRRDAVARVIGAAETLESSGKAPEAAEVFRRALKSARDLDQVQLLAKKLETFGDKVDLPTHFGYVMSWKLVGPFDNTDEKGFDVAFPPERGVDFAAEYPGKAGPLKWIDHATDDPAGKVDINKALVKANSVTCYAATEFQAKAAGPVELRLQSTNANKIWLNGELLSANKVYHAGSQMDQYIGRGKLKAGRNMILVKICQNEQKESWAQDWDFQLRVCDASGTAILSRDRVARATSQPAR
jgi:hypothetical protein